MEFAEAKENARRLANDFGNAPELNEADTRFHIIDRLLFECLDWPSDEVHLEKAQGQEYSDYELHTPPLAILEAKRTAVTFRIPITRRSALFRQIKDIASASPECSKAINQACNYSINRGCEIALACNGSQIIAMRASRTPAETNSGTCFVTQDLEDFHSNFFEAWKYLSYAALRERILLTKLDGFSDESAPEKLSVQIPNYPQPKTPSDMHRSMLDISELLLLNIDDQSEVEQQFLESCYCESGALNQHSLITKNMLNSRYSALFPETDSEAIVHPAAGRKNPNRLTPEILTEAISNRPIALVGDVGVGKTSFLKHLMYVSAYREFQKAMYVYIDLGRRGVFYDHPKDLVLDALETSLLERYQIDIMDSEFVMEVYKDEIKRFDRTIWGRKKNTDHPKYEDKLFEELDRLQSNRSEHTRRSVSYLCKKLRKQVIIAIDNADQRPLNVQQEAFVIAQNLASEWDATVFISIRPKTFYYSKRSGALSAYPHRVFTISPPRIDEVIDKRLKFAIRIAEGKVSHPRLQAINVQLGGIAALLATMQDAVDRTNDVKIFLENITGGNIRDLIQFMAGFFGNPNIDLQLIVETLQHGEGFHLPIHEFWKVALKGDAQYFDSDRAMAMNVFDMQSNRPEDHFLSPMILGLLNEASSHRSKEGFVNSSDILEELRTKGFRDGGVWSSLRGMTNKKLIEAPERVTFEEDSDGLFGEQRFAFRTTTLGAYHLKVWMGSFPYLDAMCVDTPITDAHMRSKLAGGIRSHALQDRYDRALLLKEYLTNSWYALGVRTKYFDWEEACGRGQLTFDRVERALQRRA